LKRAVLAILVVTVAWLAAGAASAQASRDLAIEQSAASTVVKKGDTVTITITVKNNGTEAMPPGIGVEMVGLGGGDVITENPYVSVSPSQGSCNRVHSSESVEFCPIGELAAGATMHIAAVVRMEETMNHDVGFLGEDESGQPSNAEYSDSNSHNDATFLKISASSPPVLTGSSRIGFPGLPSGCVSGNFQLHVVVAAAGVKKVAASLFLGFDDEGEGREWQRTSHGSSQLRATVPIEQMLEYRHPYFATVYKLKVKARLEGGTRLKRTIEFQLC
jgi:Domain of unknown function DUF11